MLALWICLCVFVCGVMSGVCLARRPVEVTRMPAVHVDVAPGIERELERCQALAKAQIDVLDEDRRLEEGYCNQRVENLVRETYPKGARIVIRSGDHLRGDVAWFVGESAPKDTCNAGSLYSRTDTGTLYVCEAGAWRAK